MAEEQAYVEDEDFVPNPLDMTGTLDTTGTGGVGDPARVAPIFAADQRATAQRIVDAFDDSKPEVTSDNILLPEGDPDPEKAKEDAIARAKAFLEADVPPAGPGTGPESGGDQSEAGDTTGGGESSTPAPDAGDGGDSGSGDSGSGDSGSGDSGSGDSGSGDGGDQPVATRRGRRG